MASEQVLTDNLSQDMFSEGKVTQLTHNNLLRDLLPTRSYCSCEASDPDCRYPGPIAPVYTAQTKGLHRQAIWRFGSDLKPSKGAPKLRALR